MSEGEGAEVISFKPEPDAARDFRGRLETPGAGKPVDTLDPQLEMELLDKIPALEAAISHAEDSLAEEVEAILKAWGLTMEAIERDPRAENFVPVVREIERIEREFRGKVIEAKECLHELKGRIEDIRARLREQKEVAQGGK